MKLFTTLRRDIATRLAREIFVRRLLVKVQKLQEVNRSVAQIGCRLIDELKQNLTPRRLDQIQDLIRSNTRRIQRELREWDARGRRWRPRIKRLLTHCSDFGRAVGEHQMLLQAQDETLRLAERIQRQLGDAVAWLVLRSDPRLIAPLWERRRHHLPDQLGLSGPVLISKSAHETGRFLVIDNDLTRCLGIGDLTVVSADGRWFRPIPVEIKSTVGGGAFVEGAQLEVELRTSVSDHPVDAEIWKDFRSTLGLSDTREGHRPPGDLGAQEKEMLERSKILMEVTSRIRGRFRTPEHLLWPDVERVLSRAMTEGSYYELIEEGIMAVGIRTRAGVDMEAEHLRVLRELQDQGYAGREDLIQASSIDLGQEDWLSPYVPPIPLWPLPLELRTALLTGELFYSCAYDPAVWDRAMLGAGVTLRREEPNWILERGTERISLDHISVMKLTLGVLFSGVRPREIASIVAEALSPAESGTNPDDHSTNSKES
jgi:hypothetical protein